MIDDLHRSRELTLVVGMEIGYWGLNFEVEDECSLRESRGQSRSVNNSPVRMNSLE